MYFRNDSKILQHGTYVNKVFAATFSRKKIFGFDNSPCKITEKMVP